MDFHGRRCLFVWMVILSGVPRGRLAPGGTLRGAAKREKRKKKKRRKKGKKKKGEKREKENMGEACRITVKLNWNILAAAPLCM